MYFFIFPCFVKSRAVWPSLLLRERKSVFVDVLSNSQTILLKQKKQQYYSASMDQQKCIYVRASVFCSYVDRSKSIIISFCNFGPLEPRMIIS